MKKSTRRLSMLMALTMVLGLFAAFPAFTVSAEEAKVTVSSIAIDPSSTTGARDGSASEAILIDGASAHNPAWNASAFARTGSGKASVLALTLSEAVNVTKVVVCSVGFNSGSADGATSVTVETSDDNATWVAATGTTTATATSSKSGKMAGDITVTLDNAVKASYVRVTVIQFGYIVSFDEIEVYGTPAVAPAIGTAANPEVITEVYYLAPVIEAGTDGYFYSYTATANGTLSFTMGMPEEGTEAVASDIILVNGEVTKSFSADSIVNDYGENELSIDVATGDVVTIQVKTVDAVAANLTVYGSFTAVPGTVDNPYPVYSGTTEGTLNAGDTYFAIYGSAGYTFTATGVDSIVAGETTYTPEGDLITFIVPETEMREPFVFIAKNNGEEAKAYTFTLTAPIGTVDNPDVITELGTFIAEITNAYVDGYYYTYTATEDGILNIPVYTTTEGTLADVTINNITSGIYGDMGGGSVLVYAGDEVQVIVTSYDINDSWTFLPSTVEMEAYMSPLPGSSAENPLVPVFADGTYTGTALTGSTYFAIYGSAGYTFTATGIDAIIVGDTTYTPDEGGVITLVIPAAEDFFTPFSFVGANNGEEDKAYTFTLTAPIGSYENPAILEELGTFTSELTEGDEDGFFYQWTATEDGYITFYVDSTTGGVSVDIILNNLMSYEYKSALDADEFGLITMDVSAGDVISIEVVAITGDDWAYHATTAVVTGTFYYTKGSEQNPIVPEFVDGTYTSDELSGDNYFAIYGSTGYTFTATGVDSIVAGDTSYTPDESGLITFVVPETEMRMPFVFITNSAEAKAYTFTLTAPIGSYENPEVLESLDSFTTILEEGNDMGYYYQWTATENGYIDFFVGDITENTQVDIILTNNTTGEMSEIGVFTMDVSAGDVITIQVVAMMDETTWIYPATTATIYGSFNYPKGSEQNPIVPDFVDGAYTSDELSGNNYFAIYGSAGYTFTATGVDAIVIESVAGGPTTTHKPNADGVISFIIPETEMRAPFVFITNSEAAKAYTFTLTAPLGSYENPIVLDELGAIKVDLEAGDDMGVYYVWTSTMDDTVEFAPDNESMDVIITNTTTGAMNEIGVYTMDVSVGDVVMIQIVGIPGDDWTIPAVSGTVTGGKYVPDPIYAIGDANGDGKINSLDAAMVLRFDAEIISEIGEQADVNGDGKVNSLDAAMILKYDADIITSFPAENK